MNIQDLPVEVFRQILVHATPEEASILDPAVFKPTSSTLQLQLVSKLFHRETSHIVYRVRPLTIRLFDPEILRLLEQNTIPDIAQLSSAQSNPAWDPDRGPVANRWLPVVRRTPFHRFRLIIIHLMPLLAPVNVPARKQFDYFRRVQDPHSEFYGNPNLNYPWALTTQHRYSSDLIYALAVKLSRMDKLLTKPSVHVHFHDEPSSILAQYQESSSAIPRAPIVQLQHLPHRLSQNLSILEPTATAQTVYLPTWTPAAILQITEHMSEPYAFMSHSRCITGTQDLPHVKYFLPRRLAALQHDGRRTPAWHHNYWRTRLDPTTVHRYRARKRPEILVRLHGHNADCFSEYSRGRSQVRDIAPEAVWNARQDPMVLGIEDMSDVSSDSEGSSDAGGPSSLSHASQRKRVQPRLVLINIAEDTLEEKGCTCFGSWTCCTNPERSGCDACPVCSVAVREKIVEEQRMFHADSEDSTTKCHAAFEVEAPFTYAHRSKTSRFAHVLTGLRDLVVTCTTIRQFHLDRSREQGRMYGDLEVQRKAMEYVLRDWEVELLTCAVRRGDGTVESIRGRLFDWGACMTRCASLEGEWQDGRGVKPRMKKTTTTKTKTKARESASTDELEYARDLQQYNKGVEAVRAEITKEIEAFLGTELDVAGVKERMAWEAEEAKKAWRNFGQDEGR